MKTRNFPARKLARQLAAKEGSSRKFYTDDLRVAQARGIKTKKRRASA